MLVWDETIERAVALIGVRLHYRGDDLIARIAVDGRQRPQQWQHLLPDLEQMSARCGCVGMPAAVPAGLVTAT